ncbi:MAG: ACP phosphodiesterase [Actinomycetota bacterium]
MNYLAHLFLAEKTAESRLGNLLGDFVKGNLESWQLHYSPEIIKGIKIHRQVDQFTDEHRIYIRSKRRISPINKVYSGIIIDIFYDHFLAKNWSFFSEENLQDFIKNIYGILKDNQPLLPVKLQQVLPRLMTEDWLNSYQTIEGIYLTLLRLSRRLKRENNLALALHDLVNHYQELEADFLTFFPEAIEYVERIQ